MWKVPYTYVDNNFNTKPRNNLDSYLNSMKRRIFRVNVRHKRIVKVNSMKYNIFPINERKEIYETANNFIEYFNSLDETFKWNNENILCVKWLSNGLFTVYSRLSKWTEPGVFDCLDRELKFWILFSLESAV